MRKRSHKFFMASSTWIDCIGHLIIDEDRGLRRNSAVCGLTRSLVQSRYATDRSTQKASLFSWDRMKNTST